MPFLVNALLAVSVAAAPGSPVASADPFSQDAAPLAAAQATPLAAAQASPLDATRANSPGGTTPSGPVVGGRKSRNSAAGSRDAAGQAIQPASHWKLFQDNNMTSSLLTMVSGLAVVLGLFLLFVWLIKRAAPAATRSLPGEVLESLGRASLTPRHFAYLIRLGNKLLLVSLVDDRAVTLAEVTDPVEVDRIVGLCGQSNPHSTSTAFQHVAEQFGLKTHAVEHSPNAEVF